jgi:succinate dehydrogenase / fumarate reductase cytochrome b subunit
MLKQYLASSIGKKQIVSITGLALVLFLIAHLAGNFLIFSGPESYNAYSESLKNLGPLLWIARIGLIVMFFLHFPLAIILAKQNKKARTLEYDQKLHPDTRSLSTRFMPISGAILLLYIVSHLLDFTFTHPDTSNALVNGQNLGLYGLVFNTFLSPISSLWYIIAMAAVGFHLAHAIQSVFQTFGFYHRVYSPVVKQVSVGLGIAISLGFSSIPICVLFGIIS